MGTFRGPQLQVSDTCVPFSPGEQERGTEIEEMQAPETFVTIV
jgi:hypothetical protein